MTDMNIRPTAAGDIPGLSQVLEATELFPAEMLPDMLAPALAGEEAGFWLTGVSDGVPTGFCYTRPEEMAEGVWNMLALAVLTGQQGRGQGAALVTAVEAEVRARGARLLIVETSGTADFTQARGFYASQGYEEEARLRDFWAEGDDKVIFRKLL